MVVYVYTLVYLKMYVVFGFTTVRGVVAVINQNYRDTELKFLKKYR